MARLYLVHWNAAEIDERAARLVADGHRVQHEARSGSNLAPAIRKDPPDAVVIDLGRLPSHGRQVATWMRETKPLRHVPIVFVDGDDTKVQRCKRDFPDATFTTWGRIRGAVAKALAHPPRPSAAPAAPRGAGYSGTPLPAKLGVKAGSLVGLIGAPAGFDDTLGELPAGASVRRRASGALDVILLFAKSMAVLEKRFPAAHRALAEGGGLWLCWPKKASGVATDLTEDAVRALGLRSGLVDNKVCAVDATWSGLRFMRRRQR